MAERKPLLIYDGRCGFCRIWIDYWCKLTGDRVDYAPSQEVGSRFPQIPPEAFAESVQLVHPDGAVSSGARAVFETLGKEKIYEPVSSISEAAYRFIAKRRSLFYQLTRFTFGTRIEPTRFEATQWLFLRVLAVVYAIAFGSLAFQVEALIGSRGLLPVQNFLSAVAQSGGAIRYLAVPSIFWLGADDRTLTGMCYAGLVLSALLVITGFRRGRFEKLILVLLFVLYLSFSAVGQDFLQFQWDSLLIETGFLAIFLGRGQLVPWLFRWLVARLFFLSGAVKLLSHDPNWRNLSALRYHFHTQPLPTVLAWYTEKLPDSVLKFSTAITLAIEIGVPFLVFMPRRIRIFGAWCFIGLQVFIGLTGNYTFFNLLTITLCLFLFDDQALRRFVPEGIRNRLGEMVQSTPRLLQRFVAVVIIFLGVTHLVQTFRGTLPQPFSTVLRYTAPLEIVNTYGLFAVMTTDRNEIIIEGSDDGEKWIPYEFPYKPGNIFRAPGWIEPFQPRVDWQMWFAALSNFRANPWFPNLAVLLLEGSSPVESLFAYDPFAGHSPKYIRAIVYTYTFTDFATRRKTGAWWNREFRGTYLPPVGLRPAKEQ